MNSGGGDLAVLRVKKMMFANISLELLWSFFTL